MIFQTIREAFKWRSQPQDSPIPLPEQVSLMYQGQPNHRYKDLLTILPAGQYYQRYLSNKYQLEDVWDTIDWLSFRKAMINYSNRTPSLVKYLHGWLATAETVRKRGPHEIQHCPFCSEKETTAHLFQCKARSCRQEINKHTTTLWTKSEKFLGADLSTTIQQHFNAWMNHEELCLHQNYERLLMEQYEIGWCQFIRGRITTTIRSSIANVLHRQGHKSPEDGALLKTRQFIRLIWDCALKLWSARNHAAAKNTSDTLSIQRRKWEAMASYYYQNQHEFPDSDRRAVFSKSLQHLLQSTEKQLKRWCTQVHAALHTSIARQIKQTKAQNRSICDYFSATARPPGIKGAPT